MKLNPYFIAAPFLLIMAILFLLSGRTYWSLPFFGAAVAVFFLGLSREHEGDA